MKFVKADFTDIEEISKLYDDVCDYLCTHENYPGWKKGVYPTKDDAESGIKEGTGKSGSFGMWNHPRGHVWNVVVRPASS